MKFQLITRYENLTIRIALLLLISLIGAAVILVALPVLDPDTSNYLASTEPPLSVLDMLLAVTIAPLLETLIFQYGLLKIVKKITEALFKSDTWIPGFSITILVFAGFHGLTADSVYHSLWFILPVIPASVAFASIAIIEFQRENGKPILAVTILHALYNFALLSMKLFLVSQYVFTL